jgi:hypothetical protein
MHQNISKIESIFPLILASLMLIIISGGGILLARTMPHYEHYKLLTYPDDKQIYLICHNDLNFNVNSISNMNSLCCNDFYDLKISWSGTYFWEYPKKRIEIYNFLESISLTIIEDCEKIEK